MSHTPLRSLPITRTIVGLVIPLIAVLIAGPAVGAPDEAAPQLSIAIDNGQTSAKVGDALTYRTVVKNLGPERIAKLRITQSMPPGLAATKADSAGVITSTDVSWVVNLKAGGATTLTTQATVSKTSEQILRLASVACASTSTKSPPIVCASHSDQLAAGARAAAAADSQAATSDPAWQNPLWIFVLVGVALALMVLVIRRRTSRSAADTEHRRE